MPPGTSASRSLLATAGPCRRPDLAWRAPRSVTELITLLAQREGGLAPLVRLLRRTPGLDGLSTVRLRGRRARRRDAAVVPAVRHRGGLRRRGPDHRPPRLGRPLPGGVESWCPSPLGIELRVLIAEAAPSLRAFSPRLGFNYSVLTREFQRIDSDEPIKWFHVERILHAAGVPTDSERWREVRALWSTADSRRKKPAGAFNS